MAEIIVDKDGRRFNPLATHVVDGVVYRGNVMQFPAAVDSLGLHTAEGATPPVEYLESPSSFIVLPQDEAPYVVYAKKSDEQIAQMEIERKRNDIRSKEQEHFDDYMKLSRQFMLATMETLAEQQSITPQQLYAANKGYRGLKDLEAEIDPIRGQINELEKKL